MAMWIALLMAAWAFTVYAVGTTRDRHDLIESGDRAIHAVLGMTLLASAALVAGLIGHDFTIRYVAVYTSVNLPQPYLVPAFWTGAHGSLLFAAVALAVVSTVLLFTSGRERRIEMQLLVLLLTLLLAPLCIGFNPLARLDWVPVDGIGMHPQLQSTGAVLYPPLLYIAYACYAVSAVLVIAGAMRRKIDGDGLATITRWTIVAWVFNSLGMTAGIWWVYHEPSRAARWALFPLESGALLPWIASSVFLCVTVFQRSRGRISPWTATLVPAAFLLAIAAGVLSVPTSQVRPGEVARSPFFIALSVLIVGTIVSAGGFLSSRLRTIETIARPARRYALALAGIALAMLAAPIAGTAFRIERDLVIEASRPAAMTDGSGARWTIGSQGLSSYNVLNRQVTALALDIEREGVPLGLISTETRQYVDVQGAPVFQPSSEPGIRSSIREDIYVVLGEIAADDSATLHVAVNPLMIWLWLGGALLPVGVVALTWTPRPKSGGAS